MNIATVNVRGLNDPNKRQTFLHWLKKQNIDVTCLQETFITKDYISRLQTDWDGEVIICLSVSPHSCGCAVLFKKDFEFEIKDYTLDKEGRRLLINICHSGQIITIVCLYAPNSDTQTFHSGL